jgi:hypothetical protein
VPGWLLPAVQANIFNRGSGCLCVEGALSVQHAIAPSVESSNDCFKALNIFLRQAGSLYDANAHSDGVTLPTSDDATAYTALIL